MMTMGYFKGISTDTECNLICFKEMKHQRVQEGLLLNLNDFTGTPLQDKA